MEDLTRLVKGEHDNPHEYLGLHGDQLRIWLPGAESVCVRLGKEEKRLHSTTGLFECTTDETSYELLIDGNWRKDPYACALSIDQLELLKFKKGEHRELYRQMGGRLIEGGARFVVWAPRAKSVHLIGDFNQWNHYSHPMRRVLDDFWEIFVPGAEEQMSYQYLIRTESGNSIEKADPFAYYNGYRPNRASLLFDPESFEWTDLEWMTKRKTRNHFTVPMSIYELHLGSWRREKEGFKNYRAIAIELAQYCIEMGYTHVELMPLSGHPLDESWGYQVSGFYSVTSRFGNPRDFQFMVNHLHERGIGVIIDWVGAHFPIDTYALAQFDGSYLFEHEEMGRHPHWDTLHFNYGCKQVANFLICSALFWCDVMHVDGLRLDAVASMIYLDFGRDEGQWQPNCEGGNTNLEAISLLKKLNSWIHTRFPGVMTIAEESHAFPGVTHPVEKNGLGFDFTWAMGWMNDTLRYFETEGEYRSAAHNLITFYMQYASTERFLFPLSHDEVVHEKKSLLEKMPGKEKFAQLKMLLLLMYTLPGKQLLFMGGEFGQRSEWFESEGLHWNLLEVPEHAELKKFSERLGQFYLEHEPLWWRDYDPSGFEWLECDEGLAYYRSGDHGRILVVFNIFPNCKCPVPKSKTLFSTLENNEDNLLELPLYSAAIFEA